MKAKQKISALLCFTALAAALVAVPAAAAPSDFYVVGSIGRSTLDITPGDIDRRNLSSGFLTSSTAGASEATTGKVQLGYNLGKTFALEGGYNYLGKINFTSVTDLGAIAGDKEAHVVNLDLVGKIPMNEQFSILGRFGGYYWKTKNRMPATTLGTTGVDDTGWDLKFGAGVQYDFNPKFGLRGEYERFNGVGKDSTTGDSKVNQWSVGAVLKF